MILPMIDVPVSLIGTFAVMAVMGFTLNSLTLFGLVLAIVGILLTPVFYYALSKLAKKKGAAAHVAPTTVRDGVAHVASNAVAADKGPAR
jgi:hypothetical protein